MGFFDTKWYFLVVVFGLVGLPFVLTQCMGLKAVHDPDYRECGSGPLKYDC